MSSNARRPGKRLLPYLGLHLSILLFSATGIFTKLASRQPFLSWKFILLYGTAILLMFVYALLWQQFLKIMPLNTAYANKSVPRCGPCSSARSSSRRPSPGPWSSAPPSSLPACIWW